MEEQAAGPEDIFSVALNKISEWDDSDYNQAADEMLNEQPYLMRYAINLSDDFSDGDVEFFIFSLIALTQGFKMAGIPMDITDPDTIHQHIQRLVPRYDALDDNEEIDMEDVYKSADNPLVLRQLFSIYMHDFLDEETLGIAEALNIHIVLESIIASVESATVMPGKASDEAAVNQQVNAEATAAGSMEQFFSTEAGVKEASPADSMSSLQNGSNFHESTFSGEKRGEA